MSTNSSSSSDSIVPTLKGSKLIGFEEASEVTQETKSSTQVSLPPFAGEDASFDVLPALERELETAKAFLQKRSPLLGISLWDHMSEILNKVLSERPNNVVEFFEQYSRKIMDDRLQSKTDRLIKVQKQHPKYIHAIKAMEYIKRFFERKVMGGDDEEEEEEAEEDEELLEEEDVKREKLTTKWNLIEMNYYLELAGIGFSKMDLFYLNLAIKDIAKTHPVINCRFWGKIFGTQKNYYIIEAQFNEEELDKRNAVYELEEEEEVEENIELEEEKESVEMLEGEIDSEMLGLKPVYPPLPENPWYPPKEISFELPGQGANKYTYFVANDPVGKWVNLPDVTPKQIVIARQIKRAFTGDLESELYTYPPFPGQEQNYLRAQIARISAATMIAPKGFFIASNETEGLEEEEDQDSGEIFVNPQYVKIPLNDLADSNMSFWCHYRPHILKQGRVIWWNPKLVDNEFKTEEDEEEQEAEENLEKDEAREIGPPMLSSLQDDATLEAIIPWTTRLPNSVLSDIGVVLVRSNLWPGALTFANKGGSRFENIYVGWGHKYVTYNYSPPSMPFIENEYPLGPEIMEIDDPTVDDEEAWRLAQLKRYSDMEEEGDESYEDTRISDLDD